MTNIDNRAGGARQPDDPGTTSASAGRRDFVQRLEDAVRENPVPAALIGMGVLWMFMGGSRTSLVGDREKSVARMTGRIGDAAYDAAQRGSSSVSRAADQVGEALSDLGTRAGEMTRTAAAAVSDAGSQIVEAGILYLSRAPGLRRPMPWKAFPAR